jgi:hypothetical protein
MTDKEVMQQALEALESSRIFVITREKTKHPEGTEWYDSAITALKAALEQPEQEPVASIYISQSGEREFDDWKCKLPIGRNLLYTTPPAAQAAPVQEPVVFYRCNGCGHAYEQVHPTSCDCMGAGGFDRVEYFTAPPPAAQPEQVDCPRCGHVCSQRPWVGLTDEDVNRESSMIASQMKLAFHAGMYVAQQVLKERNT